MVFKAVVQRSDLKYECMMRFRRRLRLLINESQGHHSLLKYNSTIKFLNLLLAECQRILRCSYLYSYPYKVIIDTNNVCNLRCLHCPTGRGVSGRQKGFMTFDSFERIIDEIGKYIYIVDLFDWGEPLLNREIYEMINYAENSNICTNIHSNFNIEFNADVAEHIIRSGLSYLTVSLDGADQEVYSIYRRKGDFEKVLENSRLLIDMKKKLAKQKPHITWQFLVFPHNRHQIEAANQLANELGFDSFRVLAGVTAGLANISRDKSGGISKMKDIEKAKCDWLWTTATFHWDGGVGPCCLQFRKEDDFGLITHTSFKHIWNNDKFIYARSLFGRRRKRVVYDGSVICSNCFKAGPHK